MFGAATRHLDIVTSTHPIKDPSRGPDVANLEWETESTTYAEETQGQLTKLADM